MSGVIEVSHPLIQNHLARLRDVSTPPAEFRRLIQRLAALLAYEATKDLQVESIDVQTPLALTGGHILRQRVGNRWHGARPGFLLGESPGRIREARRRLAVRGWPYAGRLS